MNLRHKLTTTILSAKLCGVLCAMALLIVLAGSASAQRRGTISGRVVTEEGGGLPGVTLTLQAYSNGQPPTPGTSYKTVITDADGNFRFTDLPPLVYRISVQSTRGHVQQTEFDPNRLQLYRIGETVTIRMVKGGVITGRVLNANGNPVVGVNVSAIRIRDTDGSKTNVSGGAPFRLTDDRGVYRIYGLRPGTYIVVANPSQFSRNPHAYGDQAPTYYPSATRDTAVEIVVTSGVESGGIEIRHRSEQGHVISGKVIDGKLRTGTFIPISTIGLFSYPYGASVGQTYTQRLENESGFAIYGIADGEYEIVATGSGSTAEDNFRSEPRRITVKGADVTGIELRMLAMASLAGRAVLEPAANACDPKSKPSIEEIAFGLTREEKPVSELPSVTPIFRPTVAANEKGEFSMIAIAPGKYRLAPNLPNENLFVKSIESESPGAAQTGTDTATGKPAATKTDFARSGLTLKPGDRLTGVTVAIADGAASLRGKIAPAKDGGKLPSRLRVFLVPAEATATDDVLRYGEALTSDGSFVFTNFAPGKYWLLAKPVADAEPTDRMPSPVAWDAAERLKLRKAAEAAKTEIELKPCQRVKDHVLKF